MLRRPLQPLKLQQKPLALGGVFHVADLVAEPKICEVLKLALDGIERLFSVLLNRALRCLPLVGQPIKFIRKECEGFLVNGEPAKPFGKLPLHFPERDVAEAVQDLVHDVLGIAVPEAILRRAFPPSEPQQVALLKLMVRRRANHLRRHWRVGLAEPREQGGDPDRRLEQLAAKHADSDEATLLECWFDFEASLRTLPAKQREVLILKEVYGKSCEEVAVAVGIAPSSIGKYVSEAKKSLTEMREVKDDV